MTLIHLGLLAVLALAQSALYNFKTSPIKDDYRTQMTISGYRFDDDTGEILSPETKKAMTVPEVEKVVKQIALEYKQIVLERLRHVLLSEDPGKPVPAVVRLQLKHLAGKADDTLSPDLLKKIEEAGQQPASALQGSVEQAWIKSTRYWDGQKSLLEHLGNAFPPVEGVNTPRKPLVYFNATEEKLGLALAKDVYAQIGQYQIGKDMLANFQGKLPPLLVLKVDPKAAALYNPSNRSIIINHDYILNGVLEMVPASTDRPKLKKELADPTKLAQYLLDNPKLRADFVARYDQDIFHELVHAWQGRRDQLMIEMLRGNTPAADELEYEHEAFLDEHLYLHAKFLADPKGTARNPWFPSYLEFLADFDRWRDGITRTYLQNWPEAAAELPTLKELQKERQILAIGTLIARFLQGRHLEAVVQGLKLKGMDLGSGEIAKLESAHKARMSRFAATQYPKTQYEGYKTYAKLQAEGGRPDQAFYGWQRALAADKSSSEAKKELALAADQMAAWLPKNPKALNADDRLTAVVTLSNYFSHAGKPHPKPFLELAHALYRGKAEEFLALAEKERNPSARAHYAEQAEKFAKALGDKNLIRQAAKLKAPMTPP